MGLFAFLFPKKKKFRTTQEAEAFREVFRENEDIVLRVEDSREWERIQELEKFVSTPEFAERKKRVALLKYEGSQYAHAEKQYKDFLKDKKLKSYYLVKDSPELKGYEQVKATEEYQEYLKLKVIVESSDFDKKLHAAEYKAYKEMVSRPKIAALVKFEKLKSFKDYCEMKRLPTPQVFERVSAIIQSEDFKWNRKFLLHENRFELTEDYELQQTCKHLKRLPEIAKYYSLMSDPYFCAMRKWKMTFEDDFSDGRLDDRYWIARYYAGERLLGDTYGVGDDVQLYTSENVSCSGSCVGLNFRKESIIGKYWDAQVGIREKKYDYTSGMISTATSFRQLYGRFEAKIKIKHSSVTGCFWMTSDAGVPHVEVMRCQADGVTVGHVCGRGPSVKHDRLRIDEIVPHDDFYIFGLEWTPEKMVWSVNDHVVKEVTDNIPNVPMYIAFSLGANEEPSDKSVPARMEIDWVRAYRLKTDAEI